MIVRSLSRFIPLSVILLAAAPSFGHDTWLQPNTSILRTGDAIHIDVMLGNHGNDHRDFKLASKVSPEFMQVLEVVAPDGKKYDLKPELQDLGYAPKEGYYSARFVPGKAGVHVVHQTSDRVLNFGKPFRSYHSAKTYFLVSDSLDKLARQPGGFDRPLGHKIELIPEASPVAPMGPGVPIKVRLEFDGKPFAGAKVSFIPRGVTLKEGLDAEYERVTDKEGRAEFTPKMGTYYLIAAHYHRDEQGPGYESVHYSATMTLLVPQVCACCGD